ncbi:MAG: tripartite tricarboxylate transporter substrate binding protein [Betaproteobacteria bacterium]|jgi:tripartite-type tricarboxylate transporter receptor subunit TctC|nr:tripartite tricarboxylate transporter substrate binding protein [Betaproteobacteria bacterium]MDH4292956.1 tripartite tricarboxylate transporter substrate binding protein [Betaproteobacteria bacterium]MDH5342029.1 tripartite tricarboxylate transporter substrate binding protein [Betaproteobacteria bacterium]
MKMKRCWAKGVVAVLATCGLLISAGTVAAQDFPTRAVRMIVAFPPGGGSDTIARIIAQKFVADLGQRAIVDNRAGASGNIAADIVAKAPADGYTVLFGNSSLAISPAVYSKLTYSPTKDLTAISMASQYPFSLVVHPSLPVKTVKEFVALAKSKPNELEYASSGAGTMGQLSMELLRLKTGVRMTHLPYKGAAPQTIAVLTGESQAGFIVLPVAVRHFKTGKLRGLGVAGPKRSALAPEIPTMIEAGVPGHMAVQWNGLFAPSKTPAAVIEILYKSWVAAVKSPEVSQKIVDSGAEPGGNTTAEFVAFVKEETAKWAEVAKASGTKLD